MGIEYLLVRVKENSSDDFKEYRGLDLIAIRVNEDKTSLILRPIKLDQMEKFYKASYESGMKEMISNDYEYCVWYLASEDCELQCSIDINELDIVREITKEDIEDHDKNFEEFKKIHKFYEREKEIEEAIKEDEKCEEEFNKQDKVSFEIHTKDGFVGVKGIIYKGFGIEEGWNAITVLSGEYRGCKLCSCSAGKVKKIINEIRSVIGDKDIEKNDYKKIQTIISKY